MQATQRASSTASSASLLLHRSVQQNIVQQSLGSKSNARKVSPVRKRWEEFTNRFLARLMSVLGDLKSLLVLNASPAKTSEEHTSELQSPLRLECHLLLDRSVNEIFALQLLDGLPISTKV